MVWLVSASSPPQSPQAMAQPIDRFSSLPPELIQRIFDLACDWDEYERIFSAHYGPLSRCLFPLQLRSIYSRFCPTTSSDVERFDSTQLGTERAVITRELHLSSPTKDIHNALPLVQLLPRLSGLVYLGILGTETILTSFWTLVVTQPGSFPSLRSLRCVILSEKEEEDEAEIRGLNPLRHLPRLTSLEVHWDEDTKVTAPDSPLLPVLTRLWLFGCGIVAGRPGILALIGFCPALVDFGVYGVGLQSTYLIERFPSSLQSLEICDDYNFRQLFAAVPTLPQLARFKFRFESSDFLLVDFLTHLPSLRLLDLSFVREGLSIVEAVFQSLDRLAPNLRLDLDFASCDYVFDDPRVDWTDDWLEQYRQCDDMDEVEWEKPWHTNADLQPLTKLVEQAQSKGVVVNHNLEAAHKAARHYIVEFNNRVIVHAMAHGDAHDAEMVSRVAQDFDFPIPSYPPEWFESGGNFTYRKVPVPEQDWFLIVVSEDVNDEHDSDCDCGGDGDRIYYGSDGKFFIYTSDGGSNGWDSSSEGDSTEGSESDE